MPLTITYRLLVLSWITAQRQLIHEKTASRSEWNTKYDFIVVGAGSAGSAVAMRLSEDKSTNVLLLEAGGPQSAIYNDIPGMWLSNAKSGDINTWKFYNEPQKYVGKQYAEGRIPEFRGKTLGGSSAHNGMIYNRGNRLGFDDWAKTYGAKGWGYEDVLPYFRKFENNTDYRIVRQNPGYYGTNGPVQISTPSKWPKILYVLNKVYKEMDYKETNVNSINQTGYLMTQSFITTDGLRAGTGNAYVDPNPHPENLHIVCKALVVKILFNGLTAIGVEFIKNSKSYKVFADKEVVISAGPINSPQLLMLSGIGPKHSLEKLDIAQIINLPVGENYENHPSIRFFLKINPYLSHSAPQLKVEPLSELYFHRKGPLSEVPHSLFYFNTNRNLDSNWPNIQLDSVCSNDTLVLIIELVRARSRGKICLQSTNPMIPPLIDPSYFSDPQDYEDFADGIRFVLYLMETTAISHYINVSSIMASSCPPCPSMGYTFECIDRINCFIRYLTSTVSHLGGSCRMGAIERTDVVVDPLLKVKNAKNLRVCDSSVFPELPNANTNAASIMVGEKCAQIIKDCYKHD